MKPLRISTRNLRTWAELDLELPTGIAAIVGANGAGKSTIVQAIDLALFGSGREMKRCLTRGQPDTDVEVELEFEHGDEVYRVRRSYDAKGRGKPRLDLERFIDCDPRENWESLTRETIDETEAELERILGLSRQTFRASSYLAQGDGAAFTMAEPRERKAILLDALGVRLWDRLKEEAGARRTTAEQALGKRLAVLEQLEGNLALRTAAEAEHEAARIAHDAIVYVIADLEVGLADVQAELEEALARVGEASARRERADSARRRVSEATTAISTLRQKIAEAEASTNGRAELEERASWLPVLERAQEFRRQADAKSTAAEELEALAVQAERERTQATEQADDLVEKAATLTAELDDPLALCPLCRQPLAGEALETAHDALRARLRDVEAERDAMLARAQEAARRAEDVEKSIAERSSEVIALLTAASEELARIPEAGRSLSPEVARTAAQTVAVLDERSRALDGDRRELVSLEAGLPDLRDEAEQAEAAAQEFVDVVGIDDLRARVTLAQASLVSKRKDLEAASARLVRAKADLDRLDEEAEKVGTLRREVAEEKTEVELLKLAERAYGRDGIPALILEASAIPQLETEANRIVRELGREYRFELRTQRETGTGAMKEVLDIVVATSSGEALYEDFSGGERTRLDLSLRIALARLLAARRGADVRLLAIDEPAYLDDEGFTQLAKVLGELIGEFETILVVSHVDALRDAFDSAIIVGGGADTGEPSRLEEVAT